MLSTGGAEQAGGRFEERIRSFPLLRVAIRDGWQRLQDGGDRASRVMIASRVPAPAPAAS
jgi:hypothetical protein